MSRFVRRRDRLQYDSSDDCGALRDDNKGGDYRTELELISQYEFYYKQAIKTSSSATMAVDQLEREIDRFNGVIRKYDLDMRDRNTKKLMSYGGLSKLYKVSPIQPASGVVEYIGGGLNSALPSGSDLKGKVAQLFQGSTPVTFAKKISPIVSQDEATELIRLSEFLGYRPFVRGIALSSTNGMSKQEPARTHFACTLHSEELAAWLWPRVQPLVRGYHKHFNCKVMRPTNLNPCMRFSRYDEGQLLETHVDDYHQRFDRNPVERSFLTVVVYLNEGFECGEIRFVNSRDSTKSDQERVLLAVSPTTGLGVVFQHTLLHEARAPRGTKPKYIMRTDVVFK